MTRPIHVADETPPATWYRAMRKAVGWGDVTEEAAREGLGRSLYSVCAYRDEELAGCGRVVGDGALYFYVQDVIVDPRHQGQGIGRRIMERIIGYLDAHVPPGGFVGLMAAEGTETFYRRFGFEPRPAGSPGMVRTARPRDD